MPGTSVMAFAVAGVPRKRRPRERARGRPEGVWWRGVGRVGGFSRLAGPPGLPVLSAWLGVAAGGSGPWVLMGLKPNRGPRAARRCRVVGVGRGLVRARWPLSAKLWRLCTLCDHFRVRFG